MMYLYATGRSLSATNYSEPIWPRSLLFATAELCPQSCRQSSSDFPPKKDSSRAESHRERGTCKRDRAVVGRRTGTENAWKSRASCPETRRSRRQGAIEAFSPLLSVSDTKNFLLVFSRPRRASHVCYQAHRLPIVASVAGMTNLSFSTQCLRWLLKRISSSARP